MVSSRVSRALINRKRPYKWKRKMPHAKRKHVPFGRFKVRIAFINKLACNFTITLLKSNMSILDYIQNDSITI